MLLIFEHIGENRLAHGCEDLMQ